jgi:hypothetical protein
MGKEMITKIIIPIIGSLIYLPAFGFLLVVGIANGTIPQVAFCLLAMLCLGALFYRSWKEKYLPKVALGVLAVFPGGLWIFQTIRRIGFVLREGGMERADGYGSPLAFLLGVVGEGLILGLPAILLIAVAILHRNPTKTHPDGGINSVPLRSTT